MCTFLRITLLQLDQSMAQYASSYLISYHLPACMFVRLCRLSIVLDTIQSTCIIATLRPSRVTTTSWPARSWSSLSEFNLFKAVCHLPRLLSLVLFALLAPKHDDSVPALPAVPVAPWLPETHRRRFHSLNKVVLVHLLACLTVFTDVLVSPDTTSASPAAICTAPKCTLKDYQGIQGVIEADISNHINDLLIKGNRILPRP